MSRILRRPMFRGGGKVSSYGTGIASGLTNQPRGYARGGSIHTPKRGIVKGPGSYSYADNWKNINWKNVSDSAKNTGSQIIQQAKDKVSTGTNKTKNLYNKSKSFLKSKNFSEAGLKKAIKKYGPKVLKAGKTGIMGTVKRFPLASRVAVPYALYSAAQPTPVDEKYGITRMENLFPMIGDTKSTMEKKFKRNIEEEANPNNPWRYNKYKYGPRKEHPDYDPEKSSYWPWAKGAAETDLESKKAPTGIIGPPGGGDPEMTYTKPEIEEPAPLTMKQQVEKDKALFAELLGEGEARGKDVSDMLLRFAGSGGNTVGEKFQQYIGAEAMAGPSRTEKINQAAASLAINDYIAGKRSKENMEMMLEKTKFGVDYTLDAQKAAKDIKGMEFGDALTFYAENVFKGKKGRMDPAVIKGVLSIQREGTPISIKTFSNKNIGDIKSEELDIGLNIVTYKGGKKILEKLSETEVNEVPNLYIT